MAVSSSPELGSAHAQYNLHDVFPGSDEMAGRCRSFDWSATSLGPVDRWSTSLRTMAGVVLTSRNPMLLLWGPDLIQIYNDAFRPSLGTTNTPGARHPRGLGMRAEEFWADVWSLTGPQVDAVMTHGESVWFDEVHIPIERNGRLDDGWWTYGYSPVRDDDGHIAATLVVVLEVTSAVLARRDLVAERGRAEAANRAKSDFLAVMSHELRTPLNAIGGYADLMDLGVLGPVTAEQRDGIERMQRSQRHLLGLINGVLNYAKIDAGVVEYGIEEIPMEDILATSEALMAPQAGEKELLLRVEPCGRGMVARGDRDKVQQIVLNLLSNAVKFTDAGGTVAVDCSARGDGKIEVRVTDTGRGIADEARERVFQPFVQIDWKLTRTVEGVGLGLAISRDLARGMGGELAVTSVVGEGSTFTLTLPAV
jgi:signal transduction histidine kinase